MFATFILLPSADHNLCHTLLSSSFPSAGLAPHITAPLVTGGCNLFSWLCGQKRMPAYGLKSRQHWLTSLVGLDRREAVSTITTVHPVAVTSAETLKRWPMPTDQLVTTQVESLSEDWEDPILNNSLCKMCQLKQTHQTSTELVPLLCNTWQLRKVSNKSLYCGRMVKYNHNKIPPVSSKSTPHVEFTQAELELVQGMS